MPKTKTKSTKGAPKKQTSASHKMDEHSFLIIAGGGFVIIAIIMLLIGSRTATFNRIKQAVEKTELTKLEENKVSIKDSMFSPETLTVKVGSTVTWENSDTVSHNIVADDMSFDTKELTPGEKGAYTFTKAGTYQYHCSIHPEMTGTVVVEE